VKSRYIFMIDWVSLIAHDVSYLWSGQPYIPETLLAILYGCSPLVKFVSLCSKRHTTSCLYSISKGVTLVSPSLEIRWTHKLLHKTSCHLLGLYSIFFLKRFIDLITKLSLTMWIWRWIEQFKFIWLKNSHTSFEDKKVPWSAVEVWGMPNLWRIWLIINPITSLCVKFFKGTF